MEFSWGLVLLFSCLLITGVKGPPPPQDITDPQDVMVLGQIPRPFEPLQQEGKKIILIYNVPDDGVLYKIDVYTSSTAAFSLHVWDKKQGSNFQLDFKKSFNPQGNNAVETYLVAQGSQCPGVRRGDMIGLYTEQTQLSIPKYHSGTNNPKYRRVETREPPIGENKKFEKVQPDNDLRFPIKVYIMKQNNPPALGNCPPQDSQPSTDGPTTPPPATTPPAPTPPPTTQSGATRPPQGSTSTTQVFTVSLGRTPAISSTTQTQGAASPNISKLNTMYIAIGVVSGVALIAILVAVILVVKHRQKRSAASSSDAPKASKQAPKRAPKPSVLNLMGTPNPAYGANTGLVNSREYEPTHPYLSMDGPRTYTPVAPPRGNVPAFPNPYASIDDPHAYTPVTPPRGGVPVFPTAGGQGSTRQSTAYEEIGTLSQDYLQLVADDDSGVVSVASDASNKT